MAAAPDFPPAPDLVAPKRALISVSDKTGLVEAATLTGIDTVVAAIVGAAGLASTLRGQGISLVVDLVLNHVAREHEWAVRARASARCACRRSRSRDSKCRFSASRLTAASSASASVQAAVSHSARRVADGGGRVSFRVFKSAG